jgi:hypothetical protein
MSILLLMPLFKKIIKKFIEIRIIEKGRQGLAPRSTICSVLILTTAGLVALTAFTTASSLKRSHRRKRRLKYKKKKRNKHPMLFHKMTP